MQALIVEIKKTCNLFSMEMRTELHQEELCDNALNDP